MFLNQYISLRVAVLREQREQYVSHSLDRSLTVREMAFLAELYGAEFELVKLRKWIEKELTKEESESEGGYECS